MLGKEDLRSFSEGRSFLPSSMGLVLLAAVVFVPWWWLRLVQRAGSILGHHWIPVLLLALGLSGISVRASGWRRRLRSDNTRLTRRRPLAERLPLFIHVAGMLFFAVSAAAVLGLGLWAALGRPSVVLRPGVGWTVANTFDAIKIVLAVVAGIGGVVALTVRYREQDLTEAAERREDTKLFTERFTTAAGQLGSAQAAVRLAGVYAMAQLADDWPQECQTCIDVLCSYLRMPPPSASNSSDEDAASTAGDTGASPTAPHGRDPDEERQVRHTAIRLIAAHLRPDNTEVNWQAHRFDLTGAILDSGDFMGIEVKDGTTLIFEDARFPGGLANFRNASFSGGAVTFLGAKFSGAHVTFRNAVFSGSDVSFDGAAFSGSDLSFDGAEFSSRMVTFRNAKFSGGAVTFLGATFSAGDVSFDGAAFFGARSLSTTQCSPAARSPSAMTRTTAGRWTCRIHVIGPSPLGSGRVSGGGALAVFGAHREDPQGPHDLATVTTGENGTRRGPWSLCGPSGSRCGQAGACPGQLRAGAPSGLWPGPGAGLAVRGREWPPGAGVAGCWGGSSGRPRPVGPPMLVAPAGAAWPRIVTD